MSGQEYCHSILFQLQEHLVDLLCLWGIQTGCGFIQKQNFGIMQDRPCKNETLSLTFWQFPCLFLSVFIEPHLFQYFINSLFPDFQDLGEILQILPYGQIIVYPAGIRYNSDLLVDRLVNLLWVDPEDIRLPWCLSELAGQNLYGCGLSCTAGAQKAKDLSSFQSGVNVF